MICLGHKVLGLDCILRLCWSQHEPELPGQGVGYRGERGYEPGAFLSLVEREEMRLTENLLNGSLLRGEEVKKGAEGW